MLVRRIGFFLVGAMSIVQAHSLLAADMSLSAIFSQMILEPFDFLSVSLLFLIGFLMFSSFFHHLLRMLYLNINAKMKFQPKELPELLIFAVLFILLFRYSFWLSCLSCIFAVMFSLTAIKVRDEREKDSGIGGRG